MACLPPFPPREILRLLASCRIKVVMTIVKEEFIQVVYHGDAKDDNKGDRSESDDNNGDSPGREEHVVVILSGGGLGRLNTHHDEINPDNDHDDINSDTIIPVGINLEVAKHVLATAVQHLGLHLYNILEVLGVDGLHELIKDHIVVDDDAAGGEGLHLNPVEGLGKSGPPVEGVQVVPHLLG